MAAKGKKEIFLIGFFPSQEGLFREALDSFRLTFLDLSSKAVAEAIRVSPDLIFLHHRGGGFFCPPPQTL